MESTDDSPFVPEKCHCTKACNKSFFRLQCQGNHPVCIACFSKISARRGYNLCLKCPHCNGPVKKWDVIEVQEMITTIRKRGRTTRASTKNDEWQQVTVVQEIVIASDSIPEPRLEYEPIQYHRNLGYDMRVNAVVLSATYPEMGVDDERTGNVKTISVLVPSLPPASSIDIDDAMSDSDNSKIEAIFQLLHTKILGNVNEQVLNGIEQFGSPTGKTIDEVVTEETSILRRYIHALATGSRLEDSRHQVGPSFESQRAASFAATDMIRSLQRKGIGALKTIIGGQLVASPIPRGLHRILNKFGIAPSQQNNRIKELRASFDILQQALGDEIDPHDLWMVLYDNIGFRKCGNKPGWWQFIAVQLLCVRKHTLQSKGFYDIVKTPRDDGKIWDEVKSSVSFQEVLETDDVDANNLAEVVLSPIDVLLRMESQGQLPTTEECFNLCEAESFEWPFSVTDGLGKRLVEKEGATPLSTTRVCVNDQGPEKAITNYDANNVTVDRPIELDLNSKEACESLMEYALQLLKKIVGAEVKDQEWVGVEKIMNEYGVALLGDGNPTYMMNNLIKEKDDLYGNKLRSFFGGFHLMLESHRKRGDLFAKSHLEDFFSSWRTSEGQLKWVMNPGDPNQINAELVMYVLAVYVSAMRALIKSRRDAEGPECDILVSAADVVDHIIERAMSYPIVFAILIEVRYAEVIFMLQQSEKTSDVDLYITAMKYLAPMFTCAHATKYVPMVTDFLVQWFCKSTFEKKVYAEFVFTRKTKNGSTIFPDRFVEWMMRDLRMWCGNSATKNTPNILETCALGLNTRKQKRSFGANEAKSTAARENANDQGNEERRSIRIDRVFCEVLIFCIESNLFGPGPPKHICKGPAKKFGLQSTRGLFDYEVGEFSGICDRSRAALNVNTLCIRSEGVKRLEEYFNVYYVEDDDEESSRSGKGVNMATINPTMSDADQKDTNELQRCTSVDIDVLDKCYTVPELKEEIVYLNSILEGLGLDVIHTRNSQSKKQFLYHVDVAREKIMEKDREWKQRRIEEIKLRLASRNENEQELLPSIVREEIKDNFFSLEGTEKERMRSKKYIFLGTATVGNESRSRRVRFDDDDDDDDNGNSDTQPRIVHTDRQSLGLTKNWTGGFTFQ